MSNVYYLYKPERSEFFDLGHKISWPMVIFQYEEEFTLAAKYTDLDGLYTAVYVGFSKTEEQSEDQFEVWCRSVARNIWNWAEDDVLRFLLDEMDQNWTGDREVDGRGRLALGLEPARLA